MMGIAGVWRCACLNNTELVLPSPSAVFIGSPTLCREQREDAMDETPTPPQNDQKTILVVDDDASILAVVSELLIDGGYNVLTARTGAKGLEQSREFKGSIDLLLSDFQMPGMSGVELATAMTQERGEIKVLLMSGFTDGMLILNEGWHFLTKPFIASQLRALVSGLISPDKKSRFAD
jgi:DNA-binding NtrC family response regulator